MSADGSIRVKGVTFPISPNPPAGRFYIGVDDADGHFKKQDSTGAVTDYESGASYTDEDAQDAVGGILTDTTTIDFTYSDVTNQITADVKSGSISDSLLASGIDGAKLQNLSVSDSKIIGVDGGKLTAGTVTDAKLASGIDAAKISGGTVSNSEFNHLDGVTSSIQAQIDGKANTSHTHVSSDVTDFTEAAQDAIGAALLDTATIDLTYNDGSNQISADVKDNSVTDTKLTTGINANKISAGNVSNTEFDYLDGVTSPLQTQIDGKANTSHAHVAADVTDFTTAARTAVVTNGINNGVTDKAPSEDAVFDALATKLVDPTTTTGDMLYRNSGGTVTRLPIGGEDFLIRSIGGVPVWEEENLFQDFGDGSDGNLTVTGSLTLSDVAYYDTLTIGAGAALNTDGYPLYCKVLDLTNAPVNGISRNGNPGANSTTNGGAGGGAAFAARMLGTNGVGGAGAAGQSNNGVQGGAAGATNPGNGGAGGASGSSGAGGTGLAAAGIAGGAVTSTVHYGRFEYQFLRGASLVAGGGGGRGGNSGGGDGANTSRGGGGGGAGGAVLVIYAGEIITGPSTPAGVISAMGGLGGRQTNLPAGGSCGGAGGGGGGGGGYIYIAYIKKTGSAVADLIDASGGTGGAGSDGSGTGVGGNGGAGGTGGRIQLFNVTTGTGTLTVGSAGSLGSVASGTTGGTGGNGGSCKVTL